MIISGALHGCQAGAASRFGGINVDTVVRSR
jgi:hypothetical protein